MTRSGPMITSCLMLAVMVTMSAAALSQTTSKQTTLKYDPATETTYKAVIEELKVVPPSGAKPIVYLILKSSPDPGEVFLCPKKFLDDVGVVFKADDPVEITGSRIKENGEELTLAREVVKVNGGETLTLRFKDGRPAW